MPKAEVHEIPADTFLTLTTPDLLTVANHEGVIMILDNQTAVVRLKLSWPEFDLVCTKALHFLAARAQQNRNAQHAG